MANYPVFPQVAPGSPASIQYVADQVANVPVLAADGLTAHGTAVSDATTNTALVTVPISEIQTAVGGSVYFLRASGIISAPASAGATLEFNGYSGGSGGTALATMVAMTPTASASSVLFDVEMWVNFYSTTTAQAIVKATISSSNSTSAAAVFLAGNASATPVTVTVNSTLTLNAVMSSAVSGSSYESIAGYWSQVA